MSLGRYVVDAVWLEGRSAAELAKQHGISRSWIYQLLARFRQGGYQALEPRSRLLLASDTLARFKAADVLRSFVAAGEIHGLPESLLTDNGAVFTANSRRGKVVLESALERLGVQAKHSTPYHPQTCGKVERFHQSLKRFLTKQPAPVSVPLLQLQLDAYRTYYNQQRPHRALD